MVLMTDGKNATTKDGGKQAVRIGHGRGSPINYRRDGIPFTALDAYNGLSSIRDDMQKKAVLTMSGARCNRTCRIGDTDLAGQVCTRNTTNGADCRP